MLRHGLARVVAVVAVLVVLPAAWVGFCLRAGPSDGTGTFSLLSDFSDRGVVVHTAHDPSALPASPQDPHVHAGDLVVAVDGRPVAFERVGELAGRYRVGDMVRYTVERNGVTLTVPVVLHRYDVGAVVADNLPTLLLIVLLGSLVAVIVFYRPGDPAALTMLVVAVCLALGATSWPFRTQVVDLVGGRGVWPTVVGEAAFAVFWGALTFFPLVFPRPARLVRDKPWVAAAAFSLPFVLYGVAVCVAPPDAAGRLATLMAVSAPAARLLPVLIVVLAIGSYRRAETDDERRQMQLVLWASASSCVLYVALYQVPIVLRGHGLVGENVVIVLFAPAVLAVAAAVWRYRLFDLILRRSLLYTALTAALVAVFVAVGEALTALAGDRFGNDRDPWVITGVVAVVAFPSLRRTLRSQLGRVVFGARDDPYEVMARIGQDLERVQQPDELLPSMADTLARVLRLPFVAIELCDPDAELAVSVHHGAPVSDPVSVPLVHAGQQLGVLRLDVDARLEPFGAADERLLADLGRQIGTAARLVLLNAELQRSLQRVVTSRDEERQRLARDLHDGVGPILAAAVIQLGVVRDLVSTDPAEADRYLSQLVTAAQDLISDVRRIVHGLRPAALDELGLAEAIRQAVDYFAGHTTEPSRPAVDVVVDEGLDGRHLPPAIELNVYRIVLEAVNNAVRHGQATAVTVTLRASESDLAVTVADNGNGLPPHPGRGVGLHSMRDRARELGGVCTIVSPPSGGTTVTVTVPLPSRALT